MKKAFRAGESFSDLQHILQQFCVIICRAIMTQSKLNKCSDTFYTFSFPVNAPMARLFVFYQFFFGLLSARRHERISESETLS